MAKTPKSPKRRKERYVGVDVRADLNLKVDNVVETIYVDPPLKSGDLLTEGGNPKPLLTQFLRHWKTSEPKRKIIFTESQTRLMKQAVRINFGEFKRLSGQFYGRTRTIGTELADEYVGRLAKQIDPSLPLAVDMSHRLSEAEKKLMADYELELRKTATLKARVEHQRSKASAYAKKTDDLERALAKFEADAQKKRAAHRAKIRKLQTESQDYRRELEKTIEELMDARDTISLEYYEDCIEDFKTLLERDETEQIWHEWFVKHHWFLGYHYPAIKPQSEVRVDKGRLRFDLVYSDQDGLLDIIELKRPRAAVFGSGSAKPGSSKDQDTSRHSLQARTCRAISPKADIRTIIEVQSSPRQGKPATGHDRT